MLIIVVMISLIALIGLPKFTRTNARRYMDAARTRVSASLVTARQAAIQKGGRVEFRVVKSRVVVVSGTDTLIRMPLDTLFNVDAQPESLSIYFNGRGFTSNAASQTITLTRPGTATDSVFVSKWGMVQR